MATGRPDILALAGIVSQDVLMAMVAAHHTLEKAGIPHALVGGLAVGAYGYPRASKDVDFLVGHEAFISHESGIITMKPGVPVDYKGVSIDPISPPVGSEFLEAAIGQAEISEGIPVIPVAALICMKLLSKRKKDSVDVIELFNAGVDFGPVFDYLGKHAPQLVAKCEELIRESSE